MNNTFILCKDSVASDYGEYTMGGFGHPRPGQVTCLSTDSPELLSYKKTLTGWRCVGYTRKERKKRKRNSKRESYNGG